MGFFQDTLSVFKKRDIRLAERIEESDGVYTFRFEKEKDYDWTAGQYGLFTITHQKIKKATRPFSLASAPAENRIQITTVIRDNPSEFKQALLELKPGMTVKVSGPIGSFAMEDRSPSLLIAGGIGITPFRSMLKQLESERDGAGKHIQLLYMDSDKRYLFQDELDRLAEKTQMTVVYLDSRDSLHQEIDKFARLHPSEGKYFIAGPKSMVESISAYLQKHNVSKKNMKKDSFFGY